MIRALPELLNNFGDGRMLFHPVVVDVVDGDVAGAVEFCAFDRDNAVAATVVVTRDDEGGDFGGDAFGEGAAVGAKVAGDADAPLEGVEESAQVCAANGGGDKDKRFDLGPPFGVASEDF